MSKKYHQYGVKLDERYRPVIDLLVESMPNYSTITTRTKLIEHTFYAYLSSVLQEKDKSLNNGNTLDLVARIRQLGITKDNFGLITEKDVEVIHNNALAINQNIEKITDMNNEIKRIKELELDVKNELAKKYAEYDNLKREIARLNKEKQSIRKEHTRTEVKSTRLQEGDIIEYVYFKDANGNIVHEVAVEIVNEPSKLEEGYNAIRGELLDAYADNEHEMYDITQKVTRFIRDIDINTRREDGIFTLTILVKRIDVEQYNQAVEEIESYLDGYTIEKKTVSKGAEEVEEVAQLDRKPKREDNPFEKYMTDSGDVKDVTIYINDKEVGTIKRASEYTIFGNEVTKITDVIKNALSSRLVNVEQKQQVFDIIDDNLTENAISRHINNNISNAIYFETDGMKLREV